MPSQQMAAALIQRNREELVRVERALTRLRSGDYGLCSRCGEEIAEARLQAVPTPSCAGTAPSGQCADGCDGMSSPRDAHRRHVELEIGRVAHRHIERRRGVVFVDCGRKNPRLDVDRHRIEVIRRGQPPARGTLVAAELRGWRAVSAIATPASVRFVPDGER
jgi:hypothetical protein